MAFLNRFYSYVRDARWGPAFWKTNAYAPGLELPQWARVTKRKLAKAGVGFTELDNRFASGQDPALLQRVCDRPRRGHRILLALAGPPGPHPAPGIGQDRRSFIVS